jgi:hypothetical protein
VPLFHHLQLPLLSPMSFVTLRRLRVPPPSFFSPNSPTDLYPYSFSSLPASRNFCCKEDSKSRSRPLDILSFVSQTNVRIHHLFVDIFLSIHSSLYNWSELKNLLSVVYRIFKFSPSAATTRTANSNILASLFHLEDPLRGCGMDCCMHNVILLAFDLIFVTLFVSFCRSRFFTHLLKQKSYVKIFLLNHIYRK